MIRLRFIMQPEYDFCVDADCGEIAWAQRSYRVWTRRQSLSRRKHVLNFITLSVQDGVVGSDLPVRFCSQRFRVRPFEDGPMKGARFREERIIDVLKEHEGGGEDRRSGAQARISEATLYNWTTGRPRRRHGRFGSEASEAA